MEKITAEFDIFSPLWGNEESVKVFKDGTDEEKRDWMLANCKCEPKECEDAIYDEILASNEHFFIYYYDYGFNTGVRLVEL